ncbi:MAG TPA: lysylphosphatidylglycerol synthase transmembrane domain-containing protein [Rhodothermales bacterium]|nr:lysylphosphatidylglycerol synthase transmembrane domain-containing protein [Rhodothermales bacterium]HRR10099.1 lysylphosphatidylglycerol synthase transmembrane domain-containing protein [Rhodothermales bacterium]
MKTPEIIPAEVPSIVSEEVRAYKVNARNLLIPLLFSAVAFGIVTWLTYVPGMWANLAKVFKPGLLVAAILTVSLRVVIGAFRIKFVSHGRIPFVPALRTQLVWDFYANITPSVIGGTPFAALYMNKDQRIPLGEASGIMMFLMLLDQIWFAVSILIMLGASMFVEIIPASVGIIGEGAISLYFLAIMSWAAIFAYATLVRPQILEWLVLKLFSLRFLSRFKARADREMEALQARAAIIRKEKPMFFVKGVLMTASLWVCRYFLLLFVVMSITEVYNPVQIIFRAMAILLSYIIMPTPGGAGGIEAAYTVFMTPLLGAAYVAPTLFAWRFIGFYMFIIIGVFLTAKTMRDQSVRKQMGG